MKKLIILFGIILMSIMTFAQSGNTYKYPVTAPAFVLPSGDVQTQIGTKADTSSVYSRTLIDAELAKKVNISDSTSNDSIHIGSDLYYLHKLGSTVQNMPIVSTFRIGLSVALSDGVIFLQLLYPKNYSYTIDTLDFVCNVQGNYTADNENRVGVYSYNSATDTYTLVASIANNGDLWKASSGYQITAVLTTPYVTTANEILYVAELYNQSAQTTVPSLVGANLTQSMLVNTTMLHTRYLLSAQKTGQTTLPATFTAAIRCAFVPFVIVR